MVNSVALTRLALASGTASLLTLFALSACAPKTYLTLNDGIGRPKAEVARIDNSFERILRIQDSSGVEIFRQPSLADSSLENGISDRSKAVNRIKAVAAGALRPASLAQMADPSFSIAEVPYVMGETISLLPGEYTFTTDLGLTYVYDFVYMDPEDQRRTTVKGDAWLSAIGSFKFRVDEGSNYEFATRKYGPYTMSWEKIRSMLAEQTGISVEELERHCVAGEKSEVKVWNVHVIEHWGLADNTLVQWPMFPIEEERWPATFYEKPSRKP